MANVKIKLDTRRQKSDGTYNVIFRITQAKKVYTINSGISILEEYWDAAEAEVVKIHPNTKRLNLKLLKTFYQIEEAILELDTNFSIDKLRSKLGYSTNFDSNLTFKQFADQIIEQMFAVKRTGNAIVYQTAVNRLINYAHDSIRFEDLNYKLLTDFEHYLKISGLKQNSIANYFRSIRALYNLAIKRGLVERSKYPFHDVTIKSQRTAKRAISKAEIERLNNLHLDNDSPAQKALKYFMLSFYLRGISFTDMAYLKPINLKNDRIEFNRRKTGKYYSIKLFKEAKDIINDLSSDENEYILPILPMHIEEESLRAKKIIQQWIKTTNKYLKRISNQICLESKLTTYVSRHSFASIAKHLGYSNELIAESLGHEYGNRTTSIYLDAFDTDKIDAMHKHVITI